MKQAYMLPIQKQWVDMIRSGVKEYEFRPYALEVGKKVYIYESLGKASKKIEWFERQFTKEEIEDVEKEDKKLYDWLKEHWINDKRIVTSYVGAGAIVGEFVVEEFYEILGTWDCDTQYGDVPVVYGNKSNGETDNVDYLPNLTNTGYTNQKYAIEISQLKFYDKPIPKEEFVSWSKLNKELSARTNIDTRGGCTTKHYWQLFSSGMLKYEDMEKTVDDFKVTHAPQSRIKVVEREDL